MRAGRGAQGLERAETAAYGAAATVKIIEQVEEGFNFQALEHFQRNTQIPTSDLADLVDIKLPPLRRCPCRSIRGSLT